MSIVSSYVVKSIKTQLCKDWLLNKHYLRRMTSISYAFGLYDATGMLVGICTFGNAIPLTMKKSICGEKYMDIVYELNRLCTNDNLPKNINSYFISRCMELLPRPMIIVSYADKSFGHNGYIYQASNFIYTGESHTQLDWKIKGMENMHSRTLMDEYAYEKDRIKKLKQKYGDKLYQVQRQPKHRYIYFIGTKKQKKQMHMERLFQKKPYPKGDNKKYDASYKTASQLELF